jgi:thiamine-monophosphate kinase
MTSKPPLPGEFALIERYFAPLSRGFPGAYGLRDDVAVIMPSPGRELVVKTDAIVAGVDFPPDEAADLIARKALRVNLSDLAAKGAIPRAYLLDLIVPSTIDEAWIAAFAAGLAHDQAEYSIHLIGGDMSATPGPVTIAVTALGEAPVDKIIRRGGARGGDAIFVTGTIGDAALGLRVLKGELRGLDGQDKACLIDRYRLPRPRTTIGPRLIGIASAALDVSDGLVGDLRHICEVSNLSAKIEVRLIPLSSAARTAIVSDPELLTAAITAGDDYEIVFTASPAAADQIAGLGASLGTPITQIGFMADDAPLDRPSVMVLDAANRPLALTSEGWAHFAGPTL